MKKQQSAWLAGLLVAVSSASCTDGGASFNVTDHAREVLEWREWRIEQLKKPSGYLTQTGLFWLKAGSYSFGASPQNDIVFDGAAAATIGVFTVNGDGISMVVNPGVDVRHDGEKVEEIDIVADTQPSPVTVTHGSLAWSAVERVGRYGIRLRDFEHPFVKQFGPLPYFDIDPALRVTAVLRRYPEPIVSVGATVIEGLDYRPESPGIVEFEIDGDNFSLEAFASGDRLFYVFGDLTNRDDSYAAGRFLYSALPLDDGETVLDFNKSYSPPCAFNDFSTCPIASPRNRLPIRIEAGERYDSALHYSAKN